MNVKLIGSLLAVSLIACPLLYIFVGPALAKYPAYADYCRQVSKFLPGRRWKAVSDNN